jgi:hypothetical protein
MLIKDELCMVSQTFGAGTIEEKPQYNLDS